MKRALAERAKQSLPPPSLAEPNKVPRLELSASAVPNDAIPSSNNAVATPTSPAKRQKRITALASQVNQDDSAFYLKHQNRALATELLSLQDTTKALEKERDYRRQECWAACQALNSLQATWTQLETALLADSVPRLALMMDSGAPAVTGTGSMEWTRALAEALAGLGRTSADSTDQFYSDLSQLSANVTARANTLQECIWKAFHSSPPSNAAIENALYAKQLAESQMHSRFLETQVAELTQARDQIASKERKLRRNLYRISVGILTVEQAMQILDQEGDEEWLQVRLETREKVKQEEDQLSPSATSNISPVDATAAALSESKVTEYESKIADLEATLKNRDRSIEELTGKLKEKELLLNQLSLSQQSAEDAEKLQSFEATRTSLKLKEKQVLELEKELDSTREKWAQAIGNEKSAIASIEEQLTKFEKRWSEIAEKTDVDGEASHDDLPGIQPSRIVNAETIAELEHKLSQALENVRQAETIRCTLAESLELNQELQSKLEDLKSKYAALQGKNDNNTSTEKSEAMPWLSEGDGNAEETSSMDKVEREKYDREYKNHRKARKEISTLNSKLDSLKGKLERAEKDRDAILATNSRLLQQITEKDEMNAKSLSTILHLKSLTEQLKLENDNLEQQAKSASQLALAARLASNAKARVSEEMIKEKELLEEKLSLSEKETTRIKNELDKLSNDLSEGSGKVSVLQSKFENSVKRCDELVSELEAKDEEIRKLLDSLHQTEREAQSAKENLNKIMQSSAGGDVRVGASSFTVDQLNTQISVLKDRLACPVCHYRDKECIIMRCRHMHCKQCVDERISNRSRKCPTCNNKFSEKDVEDVWLS
ncbi:E3 ubiquitin-protein ligase BRE1 [Fistulifera solaris]|uniref:E3 ubiquitin protein ligase n=1 Tax=Fistulifera solaris TaxID=1519565 RepID=A0A1Z5JDL4_FISSO|nr:E3 ubiquitin-protein ligase BRE1 [Fistulifera solaris]|eukprot:GAX12110.1 E3 ubiquitin-protein ligase BRE1 [Fistulifera solaris]